MTAACVYSLLSYNQIQSCEFQGQQEAASTYMYVHNFKPTCVHTVGYLQIIPLLHCMKFVNDKYDYKPH